METGPPTIDTILCEAVEIESVEEREAFLDEACGEDAELRHRVEKLIADHFLAGDFLEDSPVALTASIDQPVAEQPGQTIGRYKLLQEIGKGGFGVVYMAEQQEPVRRQVALKIIKLGMDTKQVIARFEAERQALAMMDHPNIAKVLDAGATDSGRPYFVMELVRGIAITDYCDANHLTTKERLQLFIDVCQAVQHAHQKGIIHRDVKPTNVMVTQQDGRPVPKVIDFGIAKATEHRLTEKTLYTTYRQMIGTPEYMSPEQATFCEADIDTRSDIYSLGVLLYELLVGTTPFDAEALRSRGYDEICRVIHESDPPTPSKRLSTMGEAVTEISKHRHVEPAALRKLLRGDVDWIVMKALEKDRTRRYETVHGLSRDVDRHLSDEPVVACPPSVPYRIKKFARKHRGPVAAVAAIGATFLIGLALAIVAFMNASRELHMRVRQLYVSDVNSAYQAWKEPNLGRARDLLSRHLPRAGGRDLRGFEWHYLSAKLQRALRPTFEGQRFTSVAFSPDGSRLAAGTWEGTVKLWDVATHKEVDTLVHSSDGVRAVAFSPDGKRLVSVCRGHVVRLWDVPTGAVVRTLRHGAHKRARNAATAFSPDGSTLAVGCGDYFSGEITLWDPAGGGELGRLVGHKAAVAGVAFSSNGQLLASASLDSTVKLWDLAKRRVVRTLSGHTDRVFAVAFSPDGRTVASGSSDSTVRLWDVTSGDMRREFAGPASHVMSVAFSPDGETLAAGVSDSKVMLWRVRDGKLVHTFQGHAGPVWSVAFSPNGMQLASVGDRAKLWNVDALQSRSTDHRWRTAMAISPVDDKTLIVGYGQHVPGSTTGIAGLWNTATREYQRLAQRNERPIFSVAASRDGRLLALGGGQLGTQGVVQVWDMRATQLLWTMPIGKTPTWSVAFSADGSRLVSGEWDNRLTFWDVSAGQPCRTLNLDSFATTCMALSPDGMTLAIGGGNYNQGDIILWDVERDAKRTTLRGHGSVVWSLDFSHDGRLLASGGWDSAVKLWDMDTLQEFKNCAGHTIHVQAVCFSPDGATLASGSLDSTVKLWHVKTGDELATLEAPAPVTSVLFFPDGRTLAAGCQDRSVKLWHTDAEEVVLRPE